MFLFMLKYVSLFLTFVSYIICDKQNFKIMETNETMVYEAPQVEVVEVEVEKGFASSMNPEDWEI